MSWMRYNFFNSFQVCLGPVYQMQKESGKPILCVLVRTTPMGFNMINIETSKNIFKKHLYRRKSARKPIKSRDMCFNINFPSYVTSLDKTNHPLPHNLKTIEQLREEKIPKMNALYRMEI